MSDASLGHCQNTATNAELSGSSNYKGQRLHGRVGLLWEDVQTRGNFVVLERNSTADPGRDSQDGSAILHIRTVKAIISVRGVQSHATGELHMELKMIELRNPFLQTFALAGFTAGTVEAFLVNPFEVVKVTLQANKTR